MASEDDQRRTTADNFLSRGKNPQIVSRQGNHSLRQQERQSTIVSTPIRGISTTLPSVISPTPSQQGSQHAPTPPVIQDASFYMSLQAQRDQLDAVLHQLQPYPYLGDAPTMTPSERLNKRLLEAGLTPNLPPLVRSNRQENDDDDALPPKARGTSPTSETVQSTIDHTVPPKTVGYDEPHPEDRRRFVSTECPTLPPIKVYYLSKSNRRRQPGRHKSFILWRLEISEGYTGALQEWTFAIQPGTYEFECCNNPLVLLGSYEGTTYMFIFKMGYNTAFKQSIYLLPVGISDNPEPCYLVTTMSRGYRIGGFLHPYAYGVPGDHDELCQASGRPFYLPRCVFDDEDIIVCRSSASAHCRSIVGNYFGQGGNQFVKPFDTEQGLLARGKTDKCPKPALVPYIEQQLDYVNALDDVDKGGSFHRPTEYSGWTVGSLTPLLFRYNHESRSSSLWTVSTQGTPSVKWRVSERTAPNGPESSPKNDIPIQEVNTSLDDDRATTSVAGSSITSSSEEERRRSERRLELADGINALPPDREGARRWAEGLEWSLMSDDWNYLDQHAVDIEETTPENQRLSTDLLRVIMKCAMKHKNGMAVKSKLTETLERSHGSIFDGNNISFIIVSTMSTKHKQTT